jgi:hypothetical protein
MNIGMLLLAVLVGIGIGAALTIVFYKRKDAGLIGTHSEVQKYMSDVEARLEARVKELSTKLLPTEVQNEVQVIGEDLWEAFKAKVLADLSNLKGSHIQQIEEMIQRFETLGKEELVKLHLEKEEVKPEVEPVLTASPAEPQAVSSSEPVVPVTEEQNKPV